MKLLIVGDFKFKCTTGEVELRSGDRITMSEKQYIIIGCDDAEPTTVYCLPVDHDIPQHFKQYALNDFLSPFCDDSIAASALTELDGKPRSARGDYLVENKQ